MRIASSILLAITGTTAVNAFSAYDEYGYGDIYARSFDDFEPSIYARDVYVRDLENLEARHAEAAAWEHSDSFDEFLVRRDLYIRSPAGGGHGPGSVVEGAIGAYNMANQYIDGKVAADVRNNQPRPSWTQPKKEEAPKKSEPNPILEQAREARKNVPKKKSGTDWNKVWKDGQKR